MKIFNLILLLLFLIGCNNKTSLDYTMDKAKLLMSEEEFLDFSIKSEKKAFVSIHFGVGMQFRNQYLRNDNDSTILKYFYSLGVTSRDEMSQITFTSLHRRANKKPLNLAAQLEKVYTEKRKREKCIVTNELRGEIFFKITNVGDTVTLRMPINEDSKSSFEYVCLNEVNWDFDNEKDLLVQGIVIKKYLERLKVDFKILNRNKEDIRVLMIDYQMGDTLYVDAKNNIFEKGGNTQNLLE